VLACVTPSRYADTVADAAAWAAQRMSAPLEFLHVIDRHPPLGPGQDHSGAIGLGAQETLLAQLSDQDAARTRAAREAGRLFLNRLRERAVASGVESVDVRLRHGDIEDTLTEQQAGVRLFVLGRRGTTTEATERALGHKVEWVVRSVDKPVLVVPEPFQAPTRVLFAFDGSGVTRRGVGMVADSPLLKGLPIHLLMSGKPESQAPRLLEEARKTLEAAGFVATTAIEPGDPQAVINNAVKAQGFDCLVMGAYSHSPWRSLFVGSRTADLIKTSGIATLLLR
jgi:nucleotide-binding universal stress UspA family protein